MPLIPSLFGVSAVLFSGLASARNFVVNGGFSAGNKGFTTGYKYVPAATDALLVESNYTLARDTRDPYILNTKGITNYKDHTTGDGLFFLVNGAKNRNSLVWEQTVPGLRLGQRYRFTLWVSRWTPNQSTAAKLSIQIDGLEYDLFEDPNVDSAYASGPKNDRPEIERSKLVAQIFRWRRNATSI